MLPTTTTQCMTVSDSKSYMQTLASTVMYVVILPSAGLMIQIDLKVAVAKHLGLMALRLIDSIIVPLNTSHYALELHGYLNK